VTRPHKPSVINKELVNALHDLKAIDVQIIDVRNLTTITDTMIIASGRSDRQVRAMADKVIEKAKELGIPPIGVEGEQQGTWILVDMGDVIAHLMHPTTRAYYQLEKLWSTDELTSKSLK
jgi:ribosome-associated protein